jgi:hypothetical protein
MGDYTPIYTPGQTINGMTSTAVVGGNLLAVSATGTVGVAGAASAAVVGTAAQDAATGTLVAYYTGGVQELIASGTVTAGQTVESAAAGTVATHTGGTNDLNVVGVALTTATTGNKVRIQMNR